MPELPEAEILARGLHSRLEGRTVETLVVYRDDVLLPNADSWRRGLPGRTVESVSRAGKSLLWTFDGDVRSLWSLRMTGQPRWVPRALPLLPHTHLTVRFAGLAHELRYRDVRRFGRLRLFVKGEEHRIALLGGLGPDALAIEPETLADALSRTRAPVKAALLDQRRLAGVGNVYADEALFRAGVHPLRPARTLADDETRALARALRRVLAEGIAQGGTTIDSFADLEGKAGGFQRRHRVYGREGEACRAGCGGRVIRIALSGRSCHYCPRCQPRRRPRRAQS